MLNIILGSTKYKYNNEIIRMLSTYDSFQVESSVIYLLGRIRAQETVWNQERRIDNVHIRLGSTIL